ncbi:WD40 repeat-like protein [Rozella allomycis CSF55]|uniref:WD40 repeat-like protein n=1 Tax=Rozella allomycis (strain CSF55) TaxID=988480 RepID=A0A075B0M9_ROZAC|nr:hypothetical protein O9G_001780 [Rozella allomycis CSF55]RKP18039.1 WD40 repeat-like protein [Rozella allomycis CSF55]|eukprot:EPZ34524.1 hypothetical protein O9G_001780 [Rozella allomycis CSF55]
MQVEENVYMSLLQSELVSKEDPSTPNRKFATDINIATSSVRKKLFQYSETTTDILKNDSPMKHFYTMSPISSKGQAILSSPMKNQRFISKTPFKVLDAPELQDDFYLNLVDWSSQNVMAVGLGNCVYLWSAATCKVSKLCDLGAFDTVASLSWMNTGSHLAIGTMEGWVQLWDVQKQKRVRALTGHVSRVGSMTWNSNILTTGSRDKNIIHRDVRSADAFVKKVTGHKQEICGLKWNVHNQQLASGGNDNKLLVWDKLNEKPLYKFSDHKAAVKAIDWSPHQPGLLASGGGTADRHIRFWNTITGSSINAIDTGSQVCNLAWSKNSNEIVSTHGYSQNQVTVWKYPSMTQLATLTGHTSRVLYLAMSPDGQTVVTGAGDETLRFWNIFDKRNGTKVQRSLLDEFSRIR